LKVQQRSGASRIEFRIRQFRVGVVVEMKLGLIDGRICLNVPVAQSFFVILVFLDGRSDCRSRPQARLEIHSSHLAIWSDGFCEWPVMAAMKSARREPEKKQKIL
jgi:hypothetical protein